MANQPVEFKFVVTNTLIVGDTKRSVAFYRDVLDATALRDGSHISEARHYLDHDRRRRGD